MEALFGAYCGFDDPSLASGVRPLRTYMIVALGATLFVIVPPRVGMSSEDLSSVIQGLVTGIEFIGGGGAMLKRTAEGEILGLTTAAGLWLTTAVAIALALGRVGFAGLAVAVALPILSTLTRVEGAIAEKWNGSR